MSFLLCHECLSWVEPRHDRCPDCSLIIEYASRDPSIHDLRLAIGDLVQRLGEVKVSRRRSLPDLGMLYETTNGLFFVPHDIETITKTVESHSSGSSLAWSIAAMAWYPLLLILPFVRSRKMKTKNLSVRRPRILALDDSEQLPSMLMGSPGMFFIAQSAIQWVGRRRKCWSIKRQHSSDLKITPFTNPDAFHERMKRLVRSEAWRHVMVAR